MWPHNRTDLMFVHQRVILGGVHRSIRLDSLDRIADLSQLRQDVQATEEVNRQLFLELVDLRSTEVGEFTPINH